MTRLLTPPEDFAPRWRAILLFAQTAYTPPDAEDERNIAAALDEATATPLLAAQLTASTLQFTAEHIRTVRCECGRPGCQDGFHTILFLDPATGQMASIEEAVEDPIMRAVIRAVTAEANGDDPVPFLIDAREHPLELIQAALAYLRRVLQILGPQRPGAASA